MRVGDSWRKLASSDLAVLVLLATGGVLLHTITNGQYGFHHDELTTLDGARSLAWGYVAYPPLILACCSPSVPILERAWAKKSGISITRAKEPFKKFLGALLAEKRSVPTLVRVNHRLQN